MNSILSSVAVPVSTETFVGPKVGDILVASYGYDASIATWAKVVGVTGKSVRIVEIDAHNKHTNCMEWTSMPAPEAVVGVPETRRFVPIGTSYKVKHSSYANYYKWDGTERSCYNYH